MKIKNQTVWTFLKSVLAVFMGIWWYGRWERIMTNATQDMGSNYLFIALMVAIYLALILLFMSVIMDLIIRSAMEMNGSKFFDDFEESVTIKLTKKQYDKILEKNPRKVKVVEKVKEQSSETVQRVINSKVKRLL